MGSENHAMESVAVVAVPFPAQGHLNHLLHLSLQLASRGVEVDVHYAAPASHIRQARARVHGWDQEALRSIQFHDLGISSYVSPPPDPTADSPFPSHIMPLFDAYITGARPPLAALLHELSGSYRRVVVVHDRLNAFAYEEAARLPNGEAFGLHCLAVSILVGQLNAKLLHENGLAFRGVEHYTPKEFLECARRARPSSKISPGAGILTNTCRALEGDFVDVVAGHVAADGKKIFAIGPLNPLLPASASKQGKKRHDCLEWLDKQPPGTVRQQAKVHLIIWVLRDADRGDIFVEGAGVSRHEKLLSEFIKDTEGTGLVITGWAPQLEILANGATAAFMSHCRWNSTVESLSHGKPILAWPMHCDQPWDAELVCNYLKVGILVRPWEKHGQVIAAKAIQEVIEEAMLSDKGMAMQRRAMVLGDAVRASVADGGSSRKDLDDFIAYITSVTMADGDDATYDPMKDPERRPRRSTDPGRNYGYMVTPGNSNIVKCNLCGKVTQGGIKRHKEHLAGTGGDALGYPRASTQLRREMYEYLEKNRRNQPLPNDEDDVMEVDTAGIATVEASTTRQSSRITAKRNKRAFAVKISGKKVQSVAAKSVAAMLRRKPEDIVDERRSGCSQSTMKSSTKTEAEVHYVDMQWALFFYECGIPFNVASSRQFQIAIEASCQCGSGYKPPSPYQLREPLLRDCVKETKLLRAKHETAWKQYGCTLMCQMDGRIEGDAT
ncbi:hypothetical protein ACQ4PT_020417 [Festuca glaucescens]